MFNQQKIVIYNLISNFKATGYCSRWRPSQRHAPFAKMNPKRTKEIIHYYAIVVHYYSFVMYANVILFVRYIVYIFSFFGITLYACRCCYQYVWLFVYPRPFSRRRHTEFSWERWTTFRFIKRNSLTKIEPKGGPANGDLLPCNRIYYNFYFIAEISVPVYIFFCLHEYRLNLLTNWIIYKWK